MKKSVLASIFITLIIISTIIIFLSKNITGFATYSAPAISEEHLENLKLKAEVECLQNSQCLENSSCIGNKCIDKNEINICQKVNLYSGGTKLKIGDSINSIKNVLIDAQLPYLLPDGELVEIIDDKLIEYFYIQVIFIRENKIEKENQDYIIQNNNPLYTYKLIFSNGVDFSDKNIQGQVLKILGEEYIIGSNSDNSNIYLVSDKKNIELQNKNNIKITKDENGNVIMIEIKFSSQNKIRNNEANIDSVFNSTKLSFNHADDNSADVRIGGNC